MDNFADNNPLMIGPPGAGESVLAQRLPRLLAPLTPAESLEAEPAPRCNAEADGNLLEAIAAPDTEGRALLTRAAEKMKLSARGYHRVLRVARSLDASDGVRRPHIAEALSYRRVVPWAGA